MIPVSNNDTSKSYTGKWEKYNEEVEGAIDEAHKQANRNEKGQFEHEWGFMANSKKGDLLQCQHDSCRKWAFSEDMKNVFELSWDEFQGAHNRGEIDASESLGEPTNAFLEKPASHKSLK